MSTANVRPSIGGPPITPSSISNSGMTNCDPSRSPETVPLPVPACVTFDEESDHPGNNEQSTREDGAKSGMEYVSAIAYDGSGLPQTPTHTLPHERTSSAGIELPAFIMPFCNRISSHDLSFLERKGATRIPEPELRDEILRSYLFSVHPFMPMLDTRSFLPAIMDSESHGQVSLLLFQAVMFAGLHSLPLHVVNRLGFQSTKQARQVFFERVRSLYDFDVEPDSASVFQALVLMSSWYGRWDERRHTWHWIGLAYDVARTMGLHREPITKHGSDGARGLRKRLWWSLYIRDRLLALGTRRPMRIRDDEFDVAELTLDDFDLEYTEGLYQGKTIMPSADENTATALMCIELTKLCTCIGNVVSSRYTTLSAQPNIPHTVMMVSRHSDGHDTELQKYDVELGKWFHMASTNVRKKGSSNAKTAVGSCSEVHWAMLLLTYHTTVNVLHRAQALRTPTDDLEGQSVQNSSKLKVKDAARDITKTSQSMLHNDQVRFLGVVGVTALIAACLSHMPDILSIDEDVRDASTFRLHQCLQVLGVLRGVYASADSASSFIASVARKAGIRVLSQATTPRPHPASKSADGPRTVPVYGPEILSPRSIYDLSTNSRPTANGQGIAPSKSWQADPFSMATQSVRHLSQSQALPDEQSGHIRHDMGASALTSNSIDTSSGVPSSTHMLADSIHSAVQSDSITQSMNTMFGGPSGSLDEVMFFDWNSEMSAGMELHPMSFNYDFYSDALGMPSGAI
ncbi:hypothetical protein LTR86_011213 [Recurvomyces mirabilis]|nr:hypothetical protein LTR86_011213 [Recurvomyces mirabilis]